MSKEVYLKVRLHYLGRSPTGEGFSPNIPTESNYDICLISDKTGSMMAFGVEELEIPDFKDKPVLVKGYLKKLHGVYAFKILAIRPIEEGR